MDQRQKILSIYPSEKKNFFLSMFNSIRHCKLQIPITVVIKIIFKIINTQQRYWILNIRCTEREKKTVPFFGLNLDGTSVCRFLTRFQHHTNHPLSCLLLLPANWNSWRNDGRMGEGEGGGGRRKLGQIFRSCRVSTSRSIKLVAESCPFSWDTVVLHTHIYIHTYIFGANGVTYEQLLAQFGYTVG